MEEWKEFRPGYSVSNLGRIRNDNTGHIRKPQDKDSRKLGYLSVHVNGVNYSIHRLVATYFIPNQNPEEFVVVNHIDNNPSNNRWDNLEWCTQKMNIQHQVKQGKHTSQVSEKSKQERFKPRTKAKAYKKSKYGLPPGIQERLMAKGNKKYIAGIRTKVDGYIHVGVFDSLEEAVLKYRQAYFERYGEFPDYD
jgi:hypothetical protein